MKKADEKSRSLIRAVILFFAIFTAIFALLLFSGCKRKTVSNDDYEETVFAGTVKVNGKAHEDYYYEVYEEPRLFSVWLTITVE